MSKFKSKLTKSQPAISTASLPDIIFMLLFFFMVSTTLRDTQVQVKVIVPTATQVKKLEKKSLVSTIYIGRPISTIQNVFGTEPMIQLNDKLINKEGVPATEVKDFILFEREKLPEADKNRMTVSIKGDANIPMGIINDLKQALRYANALKINYSATRDYTDFLRKK